MNDAATLLHEAASRGDLSGVQTAITQGAHVDTKASNGRTALIAACAEGHLEILQYLVKECNADVNVKNDDGKTALHLAASKGHLVLVRYLVEQCHANVNDKDSLGDSALHMAALFNQVDIFRYFVEKCNADANSKAILCRCLLPVSKVVWNLFATLLRNAMSM